MNRIREKLQKKSGIVLSISLVLATWYGIILIGDFPSFILPTPQEVAIRFWVILTNGRLVYHSGVTLFEVVLGMALGISVAVILGYLLSHSDWLNRMLSPILVSSQAIPIVAIAPLIVIWFGPGIFSKILVCALIVFFPVLVNTMVGIRNVPEELYALMRSMNASKKQIRHYLEIPASLPIFLGGLRVGATLSVTGAVVGEFMGADKGLGFLINTARGQYDTALVFVIIFILVLMAVSFYGFVVFLERNLLRWKS